MRAVQYRTSKHACQIPRKRLKFRNQLPAGPGGGGGGARQKRFVQKWIACGTIFNLYQYICTVVAPHHGWHLLHLAKDRSSRLKATREPRTARSIRPRRKSNSMRWTMSSQYAKTFARFSRQSQSSSSPRNSNTNYAQYSAAADIESVSSSGKIGSINLYGPLLDDSGEVEADEPQQQVLPGYNHTSQHFTRRSQFSNLSTNSLDQPSHVVTEPYRSHLHIAPDYSSDLNFVEHYPPSLHRRHSQTSSKSLEKKLDVRPYSSKFFPSLNEGRLHRLRNNRRPQRSLKRRHGLLRCRASCDIPIGQVLVWIIVAVTAVTGMVVGSVFVFIQGCIQLGGIYTPLPVEQQHSPAWTTPAAKGGWAVFYNIFISKNSFLAGVGRLVVEEQLGQVGTSYAASAGDLTVYYTSIGDELDTQWLDSLCSIKYNMTCQQTAHYSSAEEFTTLTKLHQYCHHRPDQTVVYLHNKGSLHPFNKGQDRWRRTMTAAATSKLCLEPADNECNACGMLFQPLPSNHFPGNMWTAKCSYINQLLLPADYHARRSVIDEWIESETKAGIFYRKDQQGGLFPMEAHFAGKNRYEAEHWLGSHPALRPCDVSAEPNKDYWLEDDRNFSKEFYFNMAPRHDITAGWIWYAYTRNNATLTDPVLRMRDYFLLRGMIYRWLAFYGTIPDAGSWVWEWFPDGKVWRLGVKNYGVLVAVNALANLSGAAEITVPSPRTQEVVWSTASGIITYIKAFI